MNKRANVVSTRIVPAIKEFATDEERRKKSILVQGCKDIESKTTVSDEHCPASISVRMLLIPRFSLGYSNWTRDVKQAYLQGGNIAGKIYSRPPKAMRNWLRGYLLRIMILVYVLREAGGAYYTSMFISRLLMTSNLVDKYFLYRHSGRKPSPALFLERKSQVDAAAS